MIPAGETTERRFQELLDARSTRATRSSTAATRTSATRSAATARRSSAGHPLRRRRRLGRHLGPRGRLLPDGRRRRRAGASGSSRSSRALAPEDGYAHVGPSGAGHFVKMVHNGIEYGLMQAYAEGFEVMQHSEFDLDLHEIAGIWRYGSVVRSWLLELLHDGVRAGGQRARATSRPTSRTRARAAGRSTRRSTRTCRCR